MANRFPAHGGGVNEPIVPSAPARDPVSGRFLPGNLAAVSHALRTERLPAEFAHLADEVAEFVQASLLDDGGADNVTYRRKKQHEYRARIHRRICQLDAAIEVRGL